jgi:hypothetical protein
MRLDKITGASIDAKYAMLRIFTDSILNYFCRKESK